MLPDYSLLAWALIVFSTYLTGISKGGFAGGFGGLSVPLMAIAIGPVEAAGLLLPLLIAMDVFSIRAWWGRHSVSEVKRLVPAAAIGIIIGTLLSGVFDDDTVRLILGLISILFAAYMLFKPLTPRPPHPLWAWPAGIGCGFTSFLAHAGAPPVNLYLIPRGLDKPTFIATSVVTFTCVNLLKLGPYLWLGEINISSAWASLLLVPIAWAGVRSGLWLQHRVNERLFYRLIILAMATVGVQLIYRALS
ncbi:hypothetical protein L861_10230 [Litchfieldella anticariensis FP35 = DSM 16096]|uniref:Probable membrane transporter protein n=1 Tax=Litchfieldella anticariensis (strain DSM 16096 / CECT 5854 / CIP 108499 / LMG 22089 / FP35) TaxID=1121939 RepID=S2KQF3_LITA3|nr:sulfite exporter TauE/SafE family protein [Halomonas anticariensis]EPC02713.1 hypothetical protein L861_10230 [Halomonas anticariensis FP35 = DSM 16096]